MLDKSIPNISVLMLKTDTSKYPRYELPEGFSFCGYRPGMEEDWARIIFETELAGTMREARELFEKEFSARRELLPTHCLFVLDREGRAAACGSIWPGPHFDRELQRIHWVAARPGYQGKGLVKALMTKLLDTYRELGYRDDLYLVSQTWSYKALNIYRKFGFTAYKGEKPPNWEDADFKKNTERAWDMIDIKLAEYRNQDNKFLK